VTVTVDYPVEVVVVVVVVALEGGDYQK